MIPNTLLRILKTYRRVCKIFHQLVQFATSPSLLFLIIVELAGRFALPIGTNVFAVRDIPDVPWLANSQMGAAGNLSNAFI